MFNEVPGKMALLLSSSFLILFACGGGGDSASPTPVNTPAAPGNGADVPSSWRAEMFSSESCDGEQGKIMLTSTALTYYDSCYSSDPESVTDLKVTEGDGKLNVVGGSYTEYGTEYACTGAIEKLGDNTMFNLKCTDEDGDVETITLKGLKENPVKPDAALEAASCSPRQQGQGRSANHGYGHWRR